MQNCRDVEPLIAPYVDGEAAASDRAAVDAHLRGCPCCRDLVTTERAARDVLVARRAGLRTCAPGALRARCAASCPRVAVHRRWVPMSVAATLVLAVAAVFALGLTERAQALAFQMSLDHVKCSRFGGSVNASTPDPAAEGRRWLANYGWPLQVPASSGPAELELRAVRRCAVTDGRVAHLMYRWRDTPLSVFVLPADTPNTPARLERFGQDAVIWTRNGRTYAVLARARGRDLDGVVQYVKANVF